MFFLSFQEFISSACIEHLDFLQIDPDEGITFTPFLEKDMGKQFRSITNIPKLAGDTFEETWEDYNVSYMTIVYDYDRVALVLNENNYILRVPNSS